MREEFGDIFRKYEIIIKAEIIRNMMQWMERMSNDCFIEKLTTYITGLCMLK